MKRESKTRRVSFEKINVVKDYRAPLTGGFQTLLGNCSTWVDVGREEEKALEDQQD